MKCIHFPLPNGAGGMAAAHTLGKTRIKLSKFCEQYNITQYYSLTEGYHHYVWFEDERLYTLFFLVWDDKAYWRSPSLIEKDRTETSRLVTIQKQ